MIVLAVCVCMVCFHGVADGIFDDDFTHPETCHPLMTGLTDAAPSVMQSRNVSDLNTASTSVQSRGRSIKQNKNECYTWFNWLFRTADGSCNNFKFPHWGQSMQVFTRLLAPAYDDGVNSPRTRSVEDDKRLPSARVISRKVHPDKHLSTQFTIFVMQWGQFMDHEMVSTPLPIEDTRGTIQCCGDDASTPSDKKSSECFPIIFPSDDPNFRGTCMEFVRSRAAVDKDGDRIKPRENENLITSFIDASTVYGSTIQRQQRLRDSSKKYLLKTTDDNFPTDNGIDDCVKRDSSDHCFLAGDARVNEQPALTLIHTVFMRYHNVLAKQLKRASARGDGEEREWWRLRGFDMDEVIFQRTRAIVGAVMQNIMYSEWLPIVVGPSLRAKYRLDLSSDDRTRYNPRQDPRVFNAFSTAVFRFGHTLVPRSLPMSPSRRVLLRKLFFRPFEARENFDSLAEGLVQANDFEDRTQPPDEFVVEEVTGHLFENQEGERRGFDLVALNIQRGRDHGIPSYNEFREMLGLGKVSSFSDSALGSAGDDMEEVYDHVDDIDLFSGGISEPVVDGGLLGETFGELLAIQFHRVKFGDRFFFDNKRGHAGFSDRQVELIRRVRLAHVLCLTTGLKKVQRDVFRVASSENPQVDCAWLRRQHPRMSAFAGYPFDD